MLCSLKFGNVCKECVASMTISMQVRLLVLACGLVTGPVAFGQTFGSIDGETRDSTGAAISAVTVSATNNGTNAVRTAVTNDAGVYSFPSRPPGTYTLRAEKPGFKEYTPASRSEEH